jgi:hypothetical protein
MIFKEHFAAGSVAAAKRDVAKKLGSLITTGQDTLKIVLTKGEDDESETE